MKRILKYNETNGPAYGKEETTKRGLKGIPLTTDNPTIIEEIPFDDSIPNEDNIIDDEDEPQEIKKIKKPKVMKTKRFEEMYENIGPASDSKFANHLKRIGSEMKKSEDETTGPASDSKFADHLKKKDSEMQKMDDGDVINGEVGDDIYVQNDDLQRMITGLGHGGPHEITKITTDRDKNGKAHNVYWVGKHGFHQDGHQITSPWAYHITKK